ncbi:MAG: toll/interleukin-1 receptor domain-containing protein [Magnetococcales bacterium]|nr:toll/interleukin-1 receptor domain-containing protein [Magnetococcales bacterium]
MSTKVFISHSNLEPDKSFAMELAEALRLHGVDAWVDYKKLGAGDDLDAEIIAAIWECQVFVTVWSLNAFNSDWVQKEAKLASTVMEEKVGYRILPLLLSGVKSAAVKWVFDKDIKSIQVPEGLGGVQAVMGEVLAALALRTPPVTPATIKPTVQPLEELVLILSNPRLFERRKQGAGAGGWGVGVLSQPGHGQGRKGFYLYGPFGNHRSG